MHVRIDGRSFEIPSGPDSKTLDLVVAIREAIKRKDLDARRDADAQALIQAARRGDAKAIRRLKRRLRL